MKLFNDIYAFGQWQTCLIHTLGQNQTLTQMHIAECKLHSVFKAWVWFTLSSIVLLAFGQWQECRDADNYLFL